MIGEQDMIISLALQVTMETVWLDKLSNFSFNSTTRRSLNLQLFKRTCNLAELVHKESKVTPSNTQELSQ